MEPYLSGLFALGGTLSGGLVTFGIQCFAQRKENARHRQKLAYETAVKAWEFWSRFKLDEIRASGGENPQALPGLNPFLASQLRLAKFLGSTDILTVPAERLAQELTLLTKQDETLMALLLKKSDWPTQKTKGSA